MSDDEPMRVTAENISVFSDRPGVVELDLIGGFEGYTMTTAVARELLLKLAEAIEEAQKGG